MADASSIDKITPSDLALLNKFNKRIESKIERISPKIKEWEKWRNYVRGKQTTGQDNDPDEVRSNLILGIVQSLLPAYYAKNPDVEVKPERQIDESNYPALEGFCKTLELVLHKVFIDRAKLKKRIHRSISSAFSAPAAWLKLSYQRDYAQDPIIVNRIADAQENLAKLDSDIRMVEDSEGDYEARKAEISAQIASLEAAVEVVSEEGIVIDRALFEEVLILDDSISDFAEYDQAKAIVHLISMTEDEIKARFNLKEISGTRYTTKAIKAKAESANQGSSDDKPTFCRVAEVWSREHQTVFTFCIGGKEWVRAPYNIERNGDRFYPFFAMYFDALDGDDIPLPPVSQWVPLQDEYIRMRTQQAQARADNVPGFMYRKNGHLTDKDVENLANRQGRRFIGVETSGATGSLSEDIAPFPTVDINPAAYDPTPIVRDLEQAAGASDASRQMIVSGKTATEAEIASQGMSARTSFRVNAIEEMIEEMARYSAQILLFEMTAEQVTAMVGEGAVWPKMPRKEIYSMVNISIRAGTSGKPNEDKERKQWTALAPELANLIKEVGAMRAGGMGPEAQALIDIFKETLRRFDERLDVDKFFEAEHMAVPPGMPIQVGPQEMPSDKAPMPAVAQAAMPELGGLMAPPPTDPAIGGQAPGAAGEVASALGGLLNQGQVQITDLLGQIAQTNAQANQSNMQAIQTQAMASEQYAGQISQAVSDMRAVAESLAQAQAMQQETMAAVVQAIQAMAAAAAAPKIPHYDRNGQIIAVIPQMDNTL